MAKTLELTEQEATVVGNALAQWSDEYATVEEHAIAHRILERL